MADDIFAPPDAGTIFAPPDTLASNFTPFGDDGAVTSKVPTSVPYSTPYSNIINDTAQKYGLDPGLMHTIAKIESSFNPRNVTGSYKGLFQLSDSEFQKHGGGDIFNPEHNARAAAQKMMGEAAQFKERFGRDPTPTEFYLIHQQGPGGIAAHIQNPDAPAWQNMRNTGEGNAIASGRQRYHGQTGPAAADAWAQAAVWGNIPQKDRAQFPGGVGSLKSADLMNVWRNRVEGPGAAQPGPVNVAQAAAAPAPTTSSSPRLSSALEGASRYETPETGVLPLGYPQPKKSGASLAAAMAALEALTPQLAAPAAPAPTNAPQITFPIPLGLAAARAAALRGSLVPAPGSQNG